MWMILNYKHRGQAKGDIGFQKCQLREGERYLEQDLPTLFAELVVAICNPCIHVQWMAVELQAMTYGYLL